jgi:hypothetical protein
LGSKAHIAKHRILNLVLVFIIAASFTGCKVKRITEKSPLLSLGDNALRVLVEDQRFEFETISSKLDIAGTTGKQDNSFKANLRIKQDSAIWLSITPVLGIEAVRVLIDKDSLKYIDKINTQYYSGNFAILDSLLDYPGEFEFITNLLVGNPVEMDQNEKYSSSVDGLYYVLHTKNKRKIRKSAERSNQKRDSIYIDSTKDRRFQKNIEKYSDDDLIVKRYYIRSGDFRVEKTVIEDILMSRTLQIDYSNFELLEGKSFPMQINITIQSPGENTKFELIYTRIKLNEPQSFPFKIPEKYARIR